MIEVIVLPSVEANVQEHYNRLAERAGFSVADEWSEMLDDGLALLQEHPAIGPVYPPLRPLRRLVLDDERYALIYAIEGRRVMVHAVVDTRRGDDYLRAHFGL